MPVFYEPLSSECSNGYGMSLQSIYLNSQFFVNTLAIQIFLTRMGITIHASTGTGKHTVSQNPVLSSNLSDVGMSPSAQQRE